ncbi:hypothetical protein BC830DRAFT_1083697 [Chytriomyces sp. MP71]|nr:hypothetical protein BC830DRAFT_1083697 [Chytriomyces sp. MP71]
MALWFAVSNVCPMDRRPLILEDIRRPDRVISNMLSKLAGECESCGFVGKRSEHVTCAADTAPEPSDTLLSLSVSRFEPAHCPGCDGHVESHEACCQCTNCEGTRFCGTCHLSAAFIHNRDHTFKQLNIINDTKKLQSARSDSIESDGGFMPIRSQNEVTLTNREDLLIPGGVPVQVEYAKPISAIVKDSTPMRPLQVSSNANKQWWKAWKKDRPVIVK